jgi:hypothetical protein
LDRAFDWLEARVPDDRPRPRAVLAGPRKVVAHPKAQENVGKVAIQRRPLVYAVEAVDHGGRVLDLALPEDAELTVEFAPDLLGGIATVRGTGGARRREGCDARHPVPRLGQPRGCCTLTATPISGSCQTAVRSSAVGAGPGAHSASTAGNTPSRSQGEASSSSPAPATHHVVKWRDSRCVASQQATAATSSTPP